MDDFRVIRHVDYFRVARESPKISGSATEVAFPQWSLQVRMLFRTGLTRRHNLVFTKCENKMLASFRSRPCSSDEQTA